jgi:hypothetical protein
MSTGEMDGPDPTDLFGGLSDEESSKEEASLDTEENTASPEGGGTAGGFLGQVEAAGVAKPPTATDGKPPSGEPPSNTAGNDDGKDPGAVDVGGVAPEAGHRADSGAGTRAAGADAEEKEAAATAAGGGGGSRPRKTLPGMDPEEALRAFAESVGMPVDAMWEGVKRGDGGEIAEIDWRYKNLKGTLPVGDMHMPYLRRLDLSGNMELKGEARGVDVTVVKFTDCFCE